MGHVALVTRYKYIYVSTNTDHFTPLALGVWYFTPLALGVQYFTPLALGVHYFTPLALGVWYFTPLALRVRCNKAVRNTSPPKSPVKDNGEVCSSYHRIKRAINLCTCSHSEQNGQYSIDDPQARQKWISLSLCCELLTKLSSHIR